MQYRFSTRVSAMLRNKYQCFTALFTGTLCCDLWCVYNEGGGQREVLLKRQSPDSGTLEAESTEICNIEIGIAASRNKSQ